MMKTCVVLLLVCAATCVSAQNSMDLSYYDGSDQCGLHQGNVGDLNCVPYGHSGGLPIKTAYDSEKGFCIVHAYATTDPTCQGAVSTKKVAVLEYAEFFAHGETICIYCESIEGYQEEDCNPVGMAGIGFGVATVLFGGVGCCVSSARKRAVGKV